ncbi:MAG: HAD family hydrolase [Gammaproteobacteria bacterium]
MKLALFDLDHTLLDGDSDELWFRFLAERGAVDAERGRAARAQFIADYHAGRLDIMAFYSLGLKPLAEHDLTTLEAWRRQFLDECIRPRLTVTARALLAGHRNSGHELAIITATNRFIAEPIAAELEVPHLLATDPEYDGRRFTGRVAGVPCFREGKLQHLHDWLARVGRTPAETWCYSDSHNDLPLLQNASHPVAVNPDTLLAEYAAEHHWPVMHIRRAGTQGTH